MPVVALTQEEESQAEIDALSDWESPTSLESSVSVFSAAVSAGPDAAIDAFCNLSKAQQEARSKRRP
jgi:hypothetical protein